MHCFVKELNDPATRYYEHSMSFEVVYRLDVYLLLYSAYRLL